MSLTSTSVPMWLVRNVDVQIARETFTNLQPSVKGTARPIHYQCILNEGEWLSTELQSFIFEHSYQYVRSTTPVSLHPAVYYAHLAADRSRAHLSDSPVSSGKKETKAADARSSTGSSKRDVEVGPLQAISNVMGLKEVMWFI
jgi:eukaryotic translation initiation factor 2C